jgi:hypothetical protein
VVTLNVLRVTRTKPSAHGLQTYLVMLSNTEQLKDRVEARRHELMAKYNELKADSRGDAASARDSVKAKLDELETTLKDGWDNLSDAVADRLNRWLNN